MRPVLEKQQNYKNSKEWIGPIKPDLSAQRIVSRITLICLQRLESQYCHRKTVGS